MTPSAATGRFVSENPGRDVQRVGTARFLGQDPEKIYQPVFGVVGNLGDSQCYLGVTEKVAVVHQALAVVQKDIEKERPQGQLVPKL